MSRATDPDRTLSELVGLSSKCRTALIHYLKPGEDRFTERHIEPYRLQETGSGNLMVQCWQLNPIILDHHKWRNFRLDRIIRIADGGSTFTPRCAVTICDGEVRAFEWGHDPAQTLGPAAEYFQYIEQSMLDGRITPDEIKRARELALPLSVDQRRGMHAQIFSNVLQEVLQDSDVSEKEARYLSGVREFLSVLGWAPGESAG